MFVFNARRGVVTAGIYLKGVVRPWGYCRQVLWVDINWQSGVVSAELGWLSRS